jgi:hypothetical protein
MRGQIDDPRTGPVAPAVESGHQTDNMVEDRNQRQSPFDITARTDKSRRRPFVPLEPLDAAMPSHSR